MKKLLLAVTACQCIQEANILIRQRALDSFLSASQVWLNRSPGVFRSMVNASFPLLIDWDSQFILEVNGVEGNIDIMHAEAILLPDVINASIHAKDVRILLKYSGSNVDRLVSFLPSFIQAPILRFWKWLYVRNYIDTYSQDKILHVVDVDELFIHMNLTLQKVDYGRFQRLALVSKSFHFHANDIDDSLGVSNFIKSIPFVSQYLRNNKEWICHKISSILFPSIQASMELYTPKLLQYVFSDIILSSMDMNGLELMQSMFITHVDPVFKDGEVSFHFSGHYSPQNSLMNQTEYEKWFVTPLDAISVEV